ncbi:MAG: LLM class flavin-dependent oxidoreductase [Acetobacteraceae bacterium]|jgi:alkanesulfonate monooxygenase SsuD/methylene tetrahydromethanopterin reductase-like flavin-dependent oxidoreductase (luciferase family)
MDVGIQMIFSTYGWPGMSDREAWQEEIRLARLADELGFDVIWSVEHHFFDYSFCPDNTQLLSYLAPLCTHADLGTAAIILPWNDPLRVAEKVSVLDLLSNGRVRLGLGRGLARREFAAFRGTMDDSRERFDEASAMIVEALRTGFIEGHGKHFPQPRIEIRPRPERSFEDRTYAVASSEDSIEAAARLKARMLMFADRPWPARLPGIERYRALYKQFNGVVAAPVVTADQCVCAATSDEANELAERHMASFVDSNLEHYELMSTHFATAKGYDAYAKKSELARSAGRDGLVNALLQVAVRGTPDQVLRAYEARRELLGDFELNSSFRFGGIPLAKAEASMRLFAKEVLPVLKTWQPAAPLAKAAAAVHA